MIIEALKKYSQEDESLRDYQQDNKQKIYDAWSRCQSVMLQMPTGTGKTRLFVSIIKDIFHYGRDNKVALKVLVLVHRTELIDQIDEELGYRYNLAHGIIQSGEKERKIYPIQLASVQTLSRRLSNWADKEFDYIIVDEAHHVKAESYQKIIKAFPHAKLLGVTATPVRLNGHGFTDTFEELIVSPSVKEFINDGYLSQYEYYSVARSSFIQKQIDGIKKFSQGDYAESELERVCDNDRIRAQVVKTYLEFANGKKGIVYTINKEHNKNLCEEFNANGVHAVAIDSDTPKEMREQYIQQFRRGEFQIICNVNLFTEGFDCPDIEFIQLARPTKSLALYLQQVGRGLRISESKEKTLFLDNVGLYNRFGFPSSKRMWRHHFEGKYDGNKTEEEVEGKEDVTSVITQKKERRQNLEEGHEKVHLIQTTEEKEYLEKRKDQFLDIIYQYAIHNVTAINEIFRSYYVKGIGIRIDFKDFRHLFENYHLYIKEQTKEIDELLKNKEFWFYDIENGETKTDELRTCRDYEELIRKLDYDFHQLRQGYNINKLKDLLNDYKDLHFTEAELYDIIYEISSENLSTIIVPEEVEEKKNIILLIIINFWWDSFFILKKKIKYFDTILKASFEGMKNRDFDNNNDTRLTSGH
jgi:superfamily II DNA or RNA helicase